MKCSVVKVRRPAAWRNAFAITSRGSSAISSRVRNLTTCRMSGGTHREERDAADELRERIEALEPNADQKQHLAPAAPA